MSKRCFQSMAGFMLSVMLLITSLDSFAQLNPPLGASPWKFANPIHHGFQMMDMSFIDNNTGLAVGFGGIARTTDAGLNWQYIPFKFINSANTVTAGNFNDVHFVTTSIAYAVGLSGLMVKSTDGGINWTQINTPLTPLSRDINALCFVNKDTGYIGGAAINTTNTTSINDAPKVYFTKNGGATWDSLVTPYRARQYNTALPAPNPVLSGFNTTSIGRIAFVNDSVGYVCGNANANRDLSAIFWKIENGVLKDYSIHRTKFGVSSYTVNHAGSTETFRGLMPINDSLVLISGTNGTIIRIKTGKNDSTANAVPVIYGAYEKGTYEVVAKVNTFPTFPPNSPLTTGSMFHMKKTPEGKIILSNGNGIAYSADNGTTWGRTQPLSPSLIYSYMDFTALDVTPNGRIITSGQIGITYDSLPGSPWRTSYKNFRPLSYNVAAIAFSGIDWADCNNGIIVGSHGTIVKTIDGGKTWVDNSSTVLDASQIGISGVAYHAVNSMFFSTFNTIYKSADQGTTNDAIFTEPNPNGQLNNFTMIGQDKIWAVGHRFSGAQRTMIFRSLNANSATPVWDTVKTFPLNNLAPQLNLVRFANQDTGYVTASRGKVYRTVDGGNTWTDISPDTTATINGTLNGTASYTGLSVINGKTLYVGGSRLRLFKSTDAGVTWTNLTLVPTTNPITITTFTNIGGIGSNGILMNDENNGYINAGIFLLKTTDGWTTWTYDVIPIGGFQHMSLYPKLSGPMQNKKLFVTNSQAAQFFNPRVTPDLFEYGNNALYTTSTTETVINASCTNPTAGSITVNATGGILPYSYSIDGGAPQASNVFTGLTQGAKTITIRDAGCQVITKTVTVPFTDNLTLTTNNDTTVCAGAPVQMLATSQATTFSWAPGSGLSNAGISNPIATVNSNAAFTVTATLNGCVKTKTVNITIKPNPVVNAGSDKTIVDGDEAQLQGSANNAVSVVWTPANTLSNAVTFSPIAKPSVTTTYIMTVKNSDNCTSTDDVKITVLPYCVKVMNAFTPNGDGANDRWIVTNGTGCTNRIKAAVFNRYGQQVYVNENYQNNWDGTFNGKPVPDGTYYYAVSYFLINGKTVIVKGDVTILR